MNKKLNLKYISIEEDKNNGWQIWVHDKGTKQILGKIYDLDIACSVALHLEEFYKRINLKMNDF